MGLTKYALSSARYDMSDFIEIRSHVPTDLRSFRGLTAQPPEPPANYGLLSRMQKLMDFVETVSALPAKKTGDFLLVQDIFSTRRALSQR